MPLPLLLIPSLLGLTLLILGLHGRRISTHPHCRKCKFDLTGLASPAVCPECGSDLSHPRAIALNLRKRLPLAIWSGATVLLLSFTLAGLIFAMAFAGTSANPYKPVWLLRLELDAPREGKADAAAIELITRLKAAKLAKPSVASLVADGLARQGDTTQPWRTAWGDIIESARSMKLVSDTDWARYARNSIVLATVARSPIRIGDSYCVGLIPDCRTAAKSILHLKPAWCICSGEFEANPANIFWDYSASARPLPQTATQRFANGAPPTSYSISLSNPDKGRLMKRPDSIGDSVVEIPVSFIVVDPTIPSFNPALLVPPDDRDRAADELVPESERGAPALPPNAIAAWKEVARATVTVVDRDTPVIKLNRDPLLRSAIRTGAETLRIRIDTSGRSCPSTPANPQYQVETHFGPTPMPVAFKLIIDDPEQGPLPLHAITCNGPMNSSGYFNCMRGNLPPQLSRKAVTVHLVPDIDAAMQTLDFNEIWGDTIVLDNVQLLDATANPGNLYSLPATGKAR